MAVTIGKRKRDVVQQKPRKATQIEVSDNSDSDDNERMKAIFQKHFEAQFKPLPEKKVKKAEVELEEAAWQCRLVHPLVEHPEGTKASIPIPVPTLP